MFQRPKPRFNARHLPGLRIAVAPPRNDGHSRKDESDENGRDDPSAADAYAALRHALSLALRARGLRSTSAAEGLIAFRVTSDPAATPPQVHCGCIGGHTQSRLHSRITCLTIRSSPEWYAITAITPAGASLSRSIGNARSSEPTSSFTAMRIP